MVGSEADPSVGSEVAGIEICATQLVDRLEVILGQPKPELSDGKTDLKTKSRNREQGGERSKTKSTTAIDLNIPPAAGTEPDPPGGAGTDHSAPPTAERQGQMDNSEYGKHLASLRTQRSSNKGSKKTASRATSKSSNAAKLQARLEATEAQVRADFHNEATERAKRALARDNARAMKEEQRLAEEELEEMENERKRREEELIRQQRRRLARLQEEQEERRQRMADEAEEEEAAIRRIAAGARAKLLTIEQMNEEMEEWEGGESEGGIRIPSPQ